MTMRNVLTTITYKENCDYQSSTLTRNLPVAIQNAQINIAVTTPNNNNRINTQNPNIFYYNDLLDITITIVGNNVKHGIVDIYYIEDDSNNKELSNDNKITITPLKVNNEGKVYLRYHPHKSGEIIVIYDGTPYYHIAEKRYQIALRKIPTYINFLTEQPVLTDIEDDVELKVQVKDIYDNPVQYGNVTFLNEKYHNINHASDGTERVIGNPIMLDEQGIGTIHYSPIQLFNKQKLFYTDDEAIDDNYDFKTIEVNDKNYLQLKKYYTFPNDFNNNQLPISMAVGNTEGYNIANDSIELIKCVYNYDNQLYGVNWKYYESHSDYTNIAILLPDTLTIQANRLIDNNKNIYLQPLTAESDNFLHLNIGEHCILKAKLLDIYGDVVSFDENVDILFQVTGTQVIYTNENYEYVPYKKNIVGKFYKNYYRDENIFIGDLTDSLPLGNYTVQAFLEPQSYNATEVIVNKFGDEDITNEGHFQQAISPKLFITVNPIKGNAKNLKINLHIDNLKSTIGINESIAGQDIIATIEHSLNNNFHFTDTDLLNAGKFYISNTNTRYNATIKDKNVCTLGDNSLSFTTPNDYYLYFYIAEGTYRYTDDNDKVQFISLPTTYSNAVIISVRDTLEPQIYIDNISDIYPGNINYRVNIDNIFDEHTVGNITITKNNNIIRQHTYTFTSLDNNFTDTLNNLSTGEYTINVVIDNGVTKSKNFTINKASLLQSNDVINTVLTHPNQNIMIMLQSSNNFLTELTGEFQGFLKFNNNITQCNIKNIQNDEETTNININDNIGYITLETPIYETGLYHICVTYSGDDNFNALDKTWNIEFNAVSSKGDIKASYDDDNLQIQLISENGQHNGQYILGEMTFSDYSGNKKYLPIIFNADGTVTINRFTQSNYEWQQYYMIEIRLNPQNTDIINILKNANSPSDALINYYQSNDNFTEIQCDEDIQIAAAMLKAQLNATNDIMLFTTYNKQTIIGEVDGTI